MSVTAITDTLSAIANLGGGSTTTRKRTTMKRAYLIGDTYQIRTILKDRGWKWDADRKAWHMDDDWDDTAHVERRVRSYGGVRNRGSFTVTIEESE